MNSALKLIAFKVATEMLAMAKHSFAVNPNPDLEITARERGWTVYFPEAKRPHS